MFENKKIFILGMARSGYEAAKVLAKRGNEIVLNDKDENQDKKHIKELEDLGVKVVLGSHPDDILDDSFDYLIKNPGIKFDHKYLKYAQEHKIKVINEIEMAYHLLPKGVKIVGITGTNGKTTTTTLTYEILKSAFPDKTHLAGNIGFPLCQILDDIKENDYLVMELGVPQLHDFYDFNPQVAVLTNIYEAHLDMFGTKKCYNENKLKIFQNHKNKNIAIINHDNEEAFKITKKIKSNKKYFSITRKTNGCYISDGKIMYQNEEIIDTKDIRIKGNHNYENAMCAIMVAKYYKVPNEIIVKVLKEFKGVEHRIEYVRTLNGIEFYNDSKATNVTSTQIALSAFENPTILLLGGLDRGHSFDALKDYMQNVKLVCSFGETNKRIEKFCKETGKKCIVSKTLEEALDKAYTVANKGDVILLSPACASWDQYKCFEDRGDEFKKLVKNLDKEKPVEKEVTTTKEKKIKEKRNIDYKKYLKAFLILLAILVVLTIIVCKLSKKQEPEKRNIEKDADTVITINETALMKKYQFRVDGIKKYDYEWYEENKIKANKINYYAFHIYFKNLSDKPLYLNDIKLVYKDENGKVKNAKSHAPNTNESQNRLPSYVKGHKEADGYLYYEIPDNINYVELRYTDYLVIQIDNFRDYIK